MPYVLVTIGMVLLVAGVRGTHGDLAELIRSDLTGPDNFLSWALAVAIVGGTGYIPSLQKLSVAFLTLLLVVLVLANRGVFDNLTKVVTDNAATPKLRGSVFNIPEIKIPQFGATNE